MRSRQVARYNTDRAAESDAMKFDWDHLPSVDASRVRLRPFHPNDCDRLYAIYSDPEVMRYWGDAPMKTRAQAEAFLAEARQDLRTRKCVQWGMRAGQMTSS